jgi:hypothetical protein
MKIVHPNFRKSVNALFVSRRLIVNLAFVSNMRGGRRAYLANLELMVFRFRTSDYL